MAEFPLLAGPEAGATTSFEDHDRLGLFCHETTELLACQPLAKLHVPRHRGDMDLENTFCQIHANHHILHVAVFSVSLLSAARLRHIAMRSGEGGNHPIYSFNSVLQAKFLNAHLFLILTDAREELEDYRRNYNEIGLHSAIVYETPIALQDLADRARR